MFFGSTAVYGNDYCQLQMRQFNLLLLDLISLNCRPFHFLRSPRAKGESAQFDEECVTWPNVWGMIDILSSNVFHVDLVNVTGTVSKRYFSSNGRRTLYRTGVSR